MNCTIQGCRIRAASVAQMNRVGIAVDLSHVGSKTTDDTIEFSKDPVVFSTCSQPSLRHIHATRKLASSRQSPTATVW